MEQSIGISRNDNTLIFDVCMHNQWKTLETKDLLSLSLVNKALNSRANESLSNKNSFELKEFIDSISIFGPSNVKDQLDSFDISLPTCPSRSNIEYIYKLANLSKFILKSNYFEFNKFEDQKFKNNSVKHMMKNLEKNYLMRIGLEKINDSPEWLEFLSGLKFIQLPFFSRSLVRNLIKNLSNSELVKKIKQVKINSKNEELRIGYVLPPSDLKIILKDLLDSLIPLWSEGIINSKDILAVAESSIINEKEVTAYFINLIKELKDEKPKHALELIETLTPFGVRHEYDLKTKLYSYHNEIMKKIKISSMKKIKPKLAVTKKTIIKKEEKTINDLLTECTNSDNDKFIKNNIKKISEKTKACSPNDLLEECQNYLSFAGEEKDNGQHVITSLADNLIRKKYFKHALFIINLINDDETRNLCFSELSLDLEIPTGLYSSDQEERKSHILDLLKTMN